MPDLTLPSIGSSRRQALPASELATRSHAPTVHPMPVDETGIARTRVPHIIDALRERGAAAMPAMHDRVLENASRSFTRYQQSGTIHLAGDIVLQSIGHGKSAEYSLSQLAAHAKDREYFEATTRYAAKHGDSVKIDVHAGVSRVTDPTLEHALAQNMPLRDPILRASVAHDVDPKLVAAVGVQETHLGADYLGATPDHYKATQRGDVERDSAGGHGWGPFQLDDRSSTSAECRRVASDRYAAADKAASMLATSLKSTHGNVRSALHLYNAGKLTTPSTKTDWGPTLGKLPYEDSTVRYYRELQSATSRSWPHTGTDR